MWHCQISVRSPAKFGTAKPPYAAQVITYLINQRLAAINLESLELRRLKNDLVTYYKRSNNFVALPSGDYSCQHHISQTRSGGYRLMAPL